MNNPEKIKEWSKKISDFKKSGKNKLDWCKENNVTGQQFGYWYNRVPVEKQTTQWLPVQVEESGINTKSDNSLTKPLSIKIGEASIEVYQGFDKELLLDILKTLNSL